MDLNQKIAQYTQERDACQETKDKAHKRILELNSLIKKLYFCREGFKQDTRTRVGHERPK